MKKIAILNTEIYRRQPNFFLKDHIAYLKDKLGLEVITTSAKGDSERIAKELTGYDMLVAIGGDGTVTEVVNGMNMDLQCLAVVPSGRGNGLARDLNIRRFATAVSAIEKEKITLIDIILCQFRINNKWFKRFVVSTSGLGYIYYATLSGNRYLKSFKTFCYPVATLFAFRNNKRKNYSINIDDRIKQRRTFTNIIINNTRHAGNFCIFPKALIRDSFFDVLLADTNQIGQAISNLSVFSKIYFYHPARRMKAVSCHVIPQSPCGLMVDGELYENVDEVVYSMPQKKLKIVSV